MGISLLTACGSAGNNPGAAPIVNLLTEKSADIVSSDDDAAILGLLYKDQRIPSNFHVESYPD